MSSIVSWEKRQLNSNAINMKSDALSLIQIFTPTGIAYQDQMKLVFLFKFMAVTSNSYEYSIESHRYVDALKPFIEMTLNTNEHSNIEDFVNRLTLVSLLCFETTLIWLD